MLFLPPSHRALGRGNQHPNTRCGNCPCSRRMHQSLFSSRVACSFSSCVSIICRSKPVFARKYETKKQRYIISRSQIDVRPMGRVCRVVVIRSISNQGLVSPNVQLLPAGDPCVVYNKLSGEHLSPPSDSASWPFKSIPRNSSTRESAPPPSVSQLFGTWPIDRREMKTTEILDRKSSQRSHAPKSDSPSVLPHP